MRKCFEIFFNLILPSSRKMESLIVFHSTSTSSFFYDSKMYGKKMEKYLKLCENFPLTRWKISLNVVLEKHLKMKEMEQGHLS